MSESNDFSMVDVSNAVDSIASDSGQAPPQRRKSKLILDDSEDNENMHVEEQQPLAEESSKKKTEPSGSAPVPDPNATVPVDIKWVQGGEKVYVTGSFTGWRKMIGLQKQEEEKTYLVTLGLPVGTHRFRFVVDNELRFSDFLPTATDLMGNFVNYIEVTPEHVQLHLKQLEEEQEEMAREEEESKLRTSRRSSVSSRGRSNSVFGFTNDEDDMGDGYSRYHEEAEDAPAKTYNYVSDIPPIFEDPKVMEQYYLALEQRSRNRNQQDQAWLCAPQLPPHLENVILNSYNSQDKDNNSGALPIPNHVVLNHLATTSVKHNTLAVASVIRYKRKYVTQVLYAPLQQ
ncbi:hypothetical protein C7M61_004124 [Candidozyma pseudohaemuli]|uniref:Association with the SNF1 complex (ASC) domain-containing protein n=1 Tax=Candidozyma pseudohaemuli TaxID=418784 RepID=A0A2P7YK31_9ASCO|nr:hypothetical protein C7M61_004124 [[Candida] pseudohaemulonii]PSK36300.1 hypothetical protein C7M61_004124 [[Candida] pseudohaemulonii]